MKIMKIIFIVIIGLMSCKTHETVIAETQSIKDVEVGKCYYSTMNEDSKIKEKSFILELIEPQYKDVEINFSNAQLENFNIGNRQYRLPIRKPHSKFIFQNENLSSFTSMNNPIGFLYCLVEVSPEYKIFTKEELATNKIIGQKIIRHSKIIKKTVKKRPKKLLKNQFFFESGTWTELRQAIASSHENKESDLIKRVKIQLIKLGYELSNDSKLNDKTRKALIDFQKKNKLKEGQLDKMTLEKLGVKY